MAEYRKYRLELSPELHCAQRITEKGATRDCISARKFKGINKQKDLDSVRIRERCLGNTPMTVPELESVILPDVHRSTVIKLARTHDGFLIRL